MKKNKKSFLQDSILYKNRKTQAPSNFAGKRVVSEIKPY